MLLNKPDTLSSQIVLYFEKEIFEGRIKEGDRIPSTTLLADRFGVNPETIQVGLKKLTERGLIERTPGKGTFARKGYNNKTVGIVFAHEIFADSNTAFFNLFLDELRNIIEREGWSYKYFVTTRKSEYDRTFHNFESSVKSGEIQAIIEFCSNKLIESWVKSSSIPHSNTDVTIDYYDFTIKGLRYLLGRGYKRIAMIMSDVSENLVGKAISEICSECALKTGQIQVFDCDSYQHEGYAAAKKILSSRKKPEALLVGHDCIFRGVLYAMLETGNRIPEDIAVLTHANKGLDIFSHIPITKLEVDPADFANEVFEEVMCKISGRKYTLKPIKPVLVPGKSCGEK